MPPKRSAKKASAPKARTTTRAAAKKPTAKRQPAAASKKSQAKKTPATAPKKSLVKKAPAPVAARAARSGTKPRTAAKSTTKPTASAAAVRTSTKSSGAASSSAYYQWLWEDDHGGWRPFDVTQNQTMENEFNRCSGTGTSNMRYNNWSYELDFTAMKQKNLSTGRVRAVKRELTKASTASVQKSKETAQAKTQRAVQKGNGVVDPLSNKVDSCHVYEGPNGDVFQCTLNQTNISTNNNKFFVLQLLEEDARPGYFLYTRWGRVGVAGQMMTEQFTNVSAALAAYKKKFRDKTLNDWDSRASFVKLPGKYFLMQIDYTGEEDGKGEEAGGGGPPKKKARRDAASGATPPSTLPASVQALMQLIGTREAMTSAMKELDIDTTRMPLGKISKAQLTRAYGYLQDIERELLKARPRVEEATALFYTLIPHDFGFRRPPLICTEALLKEKMELLETLGQLEVAAKLLEAVKVQRNPLDQAYDALKCSLTPVDKTDPVFDRIVRYARNTQGSTHTSFRIEVANVFAVARDGEDARYSKKYTSMANKRMLWHGSRTTNYMGILSQGLRIAPPEAPSTGYMFGKGIYFADCCSKSANYCFPSAAHSTGLMMLCEAALGKEKPCTSAEYMLKPQSGYNSTKGVGAMVPDERGFEVHDSVTWPMGKLKREKTSTSLIYPEYIIYDVDQCRIRYLVEMKFKF